nr:MAG TPA: Neck appendage protein [Caudoviricetes sp.]
MIYLTNGNMPLNEAYNGEIVQERNNTYQLTFRFPTSDPKWELLKEETFLTADDLHGEQDFVIFEIEKENGYVQVYANQVLSLLNNYVVNAINLDRETGVSALSRFAGSITRQHPFSFFSDIWDRHTLNTDSKKAMEVFAKDKHSILGQWGGDLVRHGYQVRLLKNGGSENESLFMYKKNLSSYQHKTSTKSLRTRITFKTTIKGEGEKTPDKHYSVTIESPLINKYSQIYEDVVEVNDQDVKDEASLRKYGEQYFRTTLCDMLEDSLEIKVVGQSDVPVQMFDVVSIYHEGFGLDVRKKITKYTYSPMAKKLKSIGFGQFKSGLANAIGTMVSDALKNETQGLLGSVDAKISKELKNADLAFDRKKEELVNQFTDELNAAKAKAEEVKRQISDKIDKKFQSFDNAAIQEARRKAEEALRSAGANASLAQEAKRISDQAKSEIDNLRSSSQTAIEQIESFKNQYGTKLNEVKNTADGLFTKMGAVETYISKDGHRQESLQRYARDESARQVSAVREQISRDYVGKSAYQEDVRGLERRFSAMSTQTNNDIATKISQYKQTVDGRFANLTSQIAGKANQVDFQRVRETSQLYERIIGRNENDISNKVARMAMTNQLFQVEVSKNEGLKTVQRQLAGSWSVQNINSAGDLISGINLGSNGQNRITGKATHITGETLIDKAVIKSAMIDKLKTANFEAGSVTSTIIGAEAVTADKVLMDQAFANKLVASNIFTDMLAAKEAFINKLRSVVVTATFLEGFQGKIGGFRFGQYANRNGYFITGINSVSVGMGNGTNAGANRNAFWANWGESLDTPGPKAWYVNTDGKMYCRNDVDFYSKVDFASTSKVNFYSRINAPRGIWIGYDDVEGEGDNPDGGYNRVVWWSQIVTGKWRQHAGITTGSDRKLKENIEPTSVKALDKINALNLVAFDYIKDKTHEEIGLIAQEVLDIIPGAVEKYEGEDNHLTINYSKFVPYLIKAIQELNQKLEKIA